MFEVALYHEIYEGVGDLLKFWYYKESLAKIVNVNLSRNVLKEQSV